MEFNIISGDLFSSPEAASLYAGSGCALAHCISADFALGKGIAKEFDQRYAVKNELRKIFTNFSENLVGHCIYVRGVLNLVTKQFYYNKPSYETLRKALISMRNLCSVNHIRRVAMPCIGCGLDRLDWQQVEQIIREVFQSTDIKITVYIK